MRAKIALGAVAAALGLVLAWFVASTDEARIGEPAASAGVELSRTGSGPGLSPTTQSSDSVASTAAERTAAADRELEVCVRHSRTREPLAGFYVEMKTAREMLGETRTDRDGCARFREPPEEGAQVIATAPYGWVLADRVRGVAREPGGRYEVLEFLAHEAGFAPLRARLVDAESGAPVAHYLVRVGTHDGGRANCVSDADGHLVSEQAYPEGPLMMWFFDTIEPDASGHEMQACFYLDVQHLAGEGDASEIELAIPTGPTYRLALRAPPDVLAGRLSASLHLAHVEPNPLTAARRTHVRRDDGDWVRFRPETRWLDRMGSGVRLAVASPDGRWLGSTVVERTTGIHEVELELTARGSVMVRVLAGGDDPLPNARVELYAANGTRWSGPLAAQSSSGNGLAEFLLVPPGAYVVGAISATHDRRCAALEVEPDRRTDLDLTLPRAQLDGEISGRVESSRDDNAATARLRLRSKRPEGREAELSVPFEFRGELRVAPFSFSGLARGDWELSALVSSGSELTPPSFEVSTNARDLVFRSAQPRTEERDVLVKIRAFDAESGRELEALRVRSLHPLEQLWGIETVDAPPALFFTARTPSELDRWRVGADGHAWVEVELDPAQRDDDAFVVTARLPRGWSGELTVLGPGFAPLAGARVRLDGEVAVESDATGHASLRRAAAPSTVEVDYRGWRAEPSGRAELTQLAAGTIDRARIMLAP
ncbi:MAG: hypothetical protein IT454_15505 [Planctomycetes bacterium]|nr:hypothetical protein [Planctomycetota bacterium]